MRQRLHRQLQRAGTVIDLHAVHIAHAELMTIWLCIKFLTLGRVGFGATRLFGKKSPLLAPRREDDD